MPHLPTFPELVLVIAQPEAALWLQLCLQLAIGAALRGEHVTFVDTGRAFSAERLVAMARSRSPQSVQVAPDVTSSIGQEALKINFLCEAELTD